MRDSVTDCDVCVVGGGSGGFGAALAAARAGARVVLIERQPGIGGVSTFGFVSNWEPGPGCSFAQEIYERLSCQRGAAAIARHVHRYSPEERYGLRLGVPEGEVTYAETLRRTGRRRRESWSVAIRPEALAATMRTMLDEAGVRIGTDAVCNEAEAHGGAVQEVRCRGGARQESLRIGARVFIDATADVALCRAAGCETMLGEDARARFNEPTAPEMPERFLNGISLCYRIRKQGTSTPPPDVSESDGPFGDVASIVGLTTAELTVNPLRLVPGMMLIERGYDAALDLARRRVFAHWHWLHEYTAFGDYVLQDIAPALGIRESHRVVTDYVLCEQDVRAGLSKQAHSDIVAIADHALDIHGGKHRIKELPEPYGIPYRCLLPKATTNLLVACRGAGFSHIAASSCRLSRTMLALGHAAGLAAADAVAREGAVRTVDVARLVKDMNATMEKK